jgi:tripartite-type tricarboxylate transporter receptor subunit TctC
MSHYNPPMNKPIACVLMTTALLLTAVPSAQAASREPVLSVSKGSGLAYPSRPIRMVVGFAAGGATDVSARVVAHKLSEFLGQQVGVDNRPGAASNLASDIVAKSTPDGHTLLIANATVAMPSLFAKLPFDVQRDLTPVSLAGYGPLALVVHPSLPAKNVRELITLAKAKPDAVSCATAGVGSFLHLATALFENLSQSKVLLVPYKGGAPAALAVLAAEVQMAFASVAAVLPHAQQNRLRVIGVSSIKRSSALPDVPTVSEGGLTGYDANSWYGMFAPAATARPIVAKLGAETARALTVVDVKSRLVSQGVEPAAGGVDEFSSYLKTEIPKWAAVIKAANIPPQ